MEQQALTRKTLVPLVVEALHAHDGAARIPEIGRYIAEKYDRELKASGDFNFVWHYEMRWAGEQLAKQKRVQRGCPKGTWRLT